MIAVSDPLPPGVARVARLGALAVMLLLVGGFLWATTAPVTTALRLHGTVGSTISSRDLQLTEGGLVRAVAVSVNQQVEAGQLLLQLDTTRGEAQLTATWDRLHRLRAQLHLASLALDMPADTAPDVPDAVLQSATQSQRQGAEVLTAEVGLLDARREAAQVRLAAVEYEMRQAGDLLALLERQAVDSGRLLTKGLATQRSHDAVMRDLLHQRLAVSERGADRQDLLARIDDTNGQIRLARSRYRQGLFALRDEAEREIQILTPELARLTQSLAQAEMRAPVAGMVTYLAATAPGMVARPGETLVTLTNPLDQPVLDLRVAPDAIDQVRLGQRGVVVFPGLPQRRMPIIHATVTSLASEPHAAEPGDPPTYLAQARLQADDLDRARAMLGQDFVLVMGMAAVVTLEGHATTLWDYVTGPVTGIWRRALQD